MQKIAFSHRVIQVFTSFVKTDACLQGYRPIQNTCCLNIGDGRILRGYASYVVSNLLKCKKCTSENHTILFYLSHFKAAINDFMCRIISGYLPTAQ
jgi:hypothetical protein